MELIKDKWTKTDGKEFINYLETFKREEKICWTKNLLKTNMPVLAILSPDINKLVKQIKKGNYLSFLDLDLNNYYEVKYINSVLISSIKDFDIMKKYLSIYSKTIDNWASVDSLSFCIKGKEDLFYDLARYYRKSKLPFERRLSLSILFKLLDNDLYIDKIFEFMNTFYEEKKYYVNMINAWLFCECFIKQREKTINYLSRHNLNNFTINKGISKCRDSYRVSKEDKEFLLKFKK